MSLYSPLFTLKPQKYVNRRVEEPDRMREPHLGDHVEALPRPRPTDDVAHSPTPSIVRIAASSYGDG